jgi:hypothetical protein
VLERCIIISTQHTQHKQRVNNKKKEMTQNNKKEEKGSKSNDGLHAKKGRREKRGSNSTVLTQACGLCLIMSL